MLQTAMWSEHHDRFLGETIGLKPVSLLHAHLHVIDRKCSVTLCVTHDTSFAQSASFLRLGIDVAQCSAYLSNVISFRVGFGRFSMWS